MFILINKDTIDIKIIQLNLNKLRFSQIYNGEFNV